MSKRSHHPGSRPTHRTCSRTLARFFNVAYNPSSSPSTDSTPHATSGPASFAAQFRSRTSSRSPALEPSRVTSHTLQLPSPAHAGSKVSVGQHPPHVAPRLGGSQVGLGLVRQPPNVRHLTLVTPPDVPPRLGPTGPRLRLPQPHGQMHLIQGPRQGLTEAVHLACGRPTAPWCPSFLQRCPPRLVLQLPR